MSWIERQRRRAAELKLQTFALYLACRHPRTPWYAKALAVCVVGYALSPIDLIPDFIPLVGHLDDIILVPLGIVLVLRLVPEPVMEECRRAARERMNAKGPRNWTAAAIIVLIWIAAASWCARLVWRWVHPGPASL